MIRYQAQYRWANDEVWQRMADPDTLARAREDLIADVRYSLRTRDPLRHAIARSQAEALPVGEVPQVNGFEHRIVEVRDVHRPPARQGRRLRPGVRQVLARRRPGAGPALERRQHVRITGAGGRVGTPVQSAATLALWCAALAYKEEQGW